MGFPKNFVWGAAAASYQIEGAAYEDGKGLSVWDTFCKKDGAVWSGHTGEVGCNHYHHYKEDVALMKEIGLQAYRLSVSWPRVLPEGAGRVNEKGLDFYDKLVDELLAAGISPYVTLFHWDYPYELYCRGGWLNPESPDWFAEYARLVVEKLSDRVCNWITYNEPQCFIGLGLYEGRHAPGDRLRRAEMLRAGHNMLLGHGKGVQAIRANSKQDAQVGFVIAGNVKMPATDSAEDREAARTAMFSINDQDTFWNNSWWLDPIYFGRYPEEGLDYYGTDVPTVAAGDMDIICQPLDFFAFNIYQGKRVRAGADGRYEQLPHHFGHPLTAFHWAVVPEVLYWGPKFYSERYKLPVFITENGLSNEDWIFIDGKVHDPQRIDFLTRYLKQLEKAIADGVDVRGYFQWSIMDNFEWACGFRERFGLIYIDYETQQRVLKDSAYWYKEVIASNGDTLGKG